MPSSYKIRRIRIRQSFKSSSISIKSPSPFLSGKSHKHIRSFHSDTQSILYNDFSSIKSLAVSIGCLSNPNQSACSPVFHIGRFTHNPLCNLFSYHVISSHHRHSLSNFSFSSNIFAMSDILFLYQVIYSVDLLCLVQKHINQGVSAFHPYCYISLPVLFKFCVNSSAVISVEFNVFYKIRYILLKSSANNFHMPIQVTPSEIIYYIYIP